MTSKFSIDNRELLQRISSGEAVVGIDFGNLIVRELAAFRLAAMDSEPVAYMYDGEDGTEYNGHNEFSGDGKGIPLYRHAQPAPVVPQDVLEALQKVARIRLDMDGFDGDRRGIADCLCDAEEALIEVVNRRAAMLQAAPVCTCPSGDGSLSWPCPVHPGNSPGIPDGWTGNDKANAALMMLDRIETVDPVDDDRIDGIKRIVRDLAAAPQLPGSEPATVPGTWIPVSEQMPEVGDIVLTAMGGVVNVGETECSAANCRFFTSVISGRELPATHWMPLPAAPQEVK